MIVSHRWRLHTPCEAVDFGVVPVDSINTKVVALVNYSRDSVLSFQWHTQGLFRNMEEFSITPESGTLYPGTHQMILFRLHCIEGKSGGPSWKMYM